MSNGKFEIGTGLTGTEPSTLVRRYFNLAKDGRVLDLCSGNGKDAIFLAEKGFEVIALNQLQEDVEKVIRQAEKKGVNVDWRNSAPQDFKIHKGRYSLIVANNVFQRIRKTELKAFSQEIIGGMKKGGLLIGSSMSVDDPYLKEFKRKRVPEIEENCFQISNGWIFSFFGRREILNLFPDLQVIQYAETDFYRDGNWRGLVEFVFRKN